MTMIGIGYLFPIAAIWAAFDYWKVMFPDINIEFPVTVVYQVVSVLAVALLSLSKSLTLGPRIIGGFCGQFVCLAIILILLWTGLAKAALLTLLLVIVTLDAVATGYLDSALMALCSQYSSKMQQCLQIGIGFGTVVSVIYRDITKIVLAGDVADATTAFFCIALMTVCACLASYRMLMSLPISRHVVRADNMQKLLDEPTTPPQSPPLMPMSPTYVPVSPMGQERRDFLDDKDLPEDGVRLNDASFKTVFRMVRRNQLTIFLNFVLTTLAYPGMITAIPCRQFLQLKPEHWFQTLLFTAFTLVDIVARFCTSYRCGLSHKNIYLTLIVRALLFPFIFYCAAVSTASDVLAFLVVASFGFLNGYCVSLSLIVINEIPELTAEQRKTCGRISAFSINSGLCIGSLLAAALASLTGLDS